MAKPRKPKPGETPDLVIFDTPEPVALVVDRRGEEQEAPAGVIDFDNYQPSGLPILTYDEFFAKLNGKARGNDPLAQYVLGCFGCFNELGADMFVKLQELSADFEGKSPLFVYHQQAMTLRAAVEAYDVALCGDSEGYAARAEAGTHEHLDPIFEVLTGEDGRRESGLAGNDIFEAGLLASQLAQGHAFYAQVAMALFRQAAVQYGYELVMPTQPEVIEGAAS